MTVVLPVWFLNAGPPSFTTAAQTAADIRAIISTEPAVLGLCEVGGDGLLPIAKGYVRFRDISSPSRANVAAYVRRDLIDRERAPRWRDMGEWWKRTEHPGMHEPRSWLELPTRFQCIVGHQPPQLPPRSGGVAKTIKVQAEGIDYLTNRVGPQQRPSWKTLPKVDRDRALARPRVVLADWNRLPYDAGPGPKELAAKIGGTVVGSRIDGAVIRGDCRAEGVTYVREIDDVKLHTDHSWGALKFNLVLPRRWQ